VPFHKVPFRKVHFKFQKGERMKLERSVHTNDLIEALEKVEEGKYISYQDLSEIAGANVQTERRSNLNSALRVLQREKKKQFVPVRGKGLRCVVNGEQIQLAQDNIRSMRRKGERTKDVLATARYGELSPKEQIDFNSTAAHVGMLSYLARTQAFGNLKKTFAGGVAASADSIKKGLDYITLGKLGKLSPPRKPWPGQPAKG
jgi:hypothetical protein